MRLLLTAGSSLLFLALAFRPLEWAFPAKPGQPFFRPAWWTDLAFFLGQYAFFTGMVLWLITRLGLGLDQALPSAFRAAVATQPWWLQAVEVVVLSDLCVY